MRRISIPELSEWMEFDATEITENMYHFANLQAKIDVALGAKRFDPSKYLPKPAKPRKAKPTVAEVKRLLALRKNG